MTIAAPPRPIEILAPAGGPEQLAAAIAAGADAVYLGLGELDARRGAVGFAIADLPKLVAQAHAAKVRVHLTLNIQLGWRELGRAARSLAWAEQSGVDAVLIADPALFALMPAFPKLEVHGSTQAGVSAASGVAALAALGARRVVLARELSLDEIAPCCAVGPEIEVFAQGALCFSVSGRCSLTSWVGGRSGNRGTCTSICRVNWSCGGSEPGRPLDMKDSSAVRVLPELAQLGVASLKIEGRLKTAAWVGEAVGLFRRARASEETPEALWAAAERLGAYTGREMTDAYFTGKRIGLVHPDQGRSAADPSLAACDDQDPPRNLTVTIEAPARGLLIRVACAAIHAEITIPASKAHPGRAVDADGLRERIAEILPDDVTLVALDDRTGSFLVPRRVANDLADRIAALLRPRADGIDRLRVTIPDAARAALTASAPHPANRTALTAAPDRARVDAESAVLFASHIPTVPVIVEIHLPAEVDRLHAALGNRLIVALPPVIYQGQIADLTAVVARAAALGLTVEINGWDGLGLARGLLAPRGVLASRGNSGATLIGGPGIAVLNPLAARVLAEQGCSLVTACGEADATMLADLCAACPVPLAITVFGRPALMTTRAWKNAPGWEMQDAKETVRIHTRREGPVVVLRPDEPFDWRSVRDPRFTAAVLEMDLSAAADPVGEWRSLPDAKASRFNLERELA